MEKLLSVSVACYNLGEMIVDNIKSFCESSVAEQIELIIVDDGSTDDTPKLVAEYAKKYPETVKFIRQSNAGPGSTVNTGLANATGKYFKMVDGDDWVQTENLPAFLELLDKTDADLVVSDFDVYDNTKQQIVEHNCYQIPPMKTVSLDEIISNNNLVMYSIAYRTTILKDNQIHLDNGFYTDNEYVFFPFPFVNSVCYYPHTIYIYRVARPGQSISVQGQIKHLTDHELILDKLVACLEQYQATLSAPKINFFTQKISQTAINQLGTYLLLPPSGETKKRIKSMLVNLKQRCPAVSKLVRKSKRCKVLVWSGYLLYRWTAKKFAKAQGV